MGFELDADPPPRPVPWVLSGTPAQLKAWRAAAERAGYRDPLRWVQGLLDAASVPPERRSVIPVPERRLVCPPPASVTAPNDGTSLEYSGDASARAVGDAVSISSDR